MKKLFRKFTGQRNFETVKGVNFFGPKCEYVMSGSDCGRIFIWKKLGGELIRVMEADTDVVNCIESHPYATVLASSGIENDVKIWAPKALERATLPEKLEKVLTRDRFHWLIFGNDDGDEYYDDDDDDSSDEDDDLDHDEDNGADEVDDDEDDDLDHDEEVVEDNDADNVNNHNDNTSNNVNNSKSWLV